MPTFSYVLPKNREMGIGKDGIAPTLYITKFIPIYENHP